MGNIAPVRQILTQLTKGKKAKALVEKIQKKKSASANYSSIEILSIVFPTEVIFYHSITIITAAIKLVSDIIKALVCQLGRQTQKF